MLPPRTLFQVSLSGALAGALALAISTLAETTTSQFPGTNSPPALAVSLQPGEIVGREQIVRALLKNGTNEFIFVVPEQLRIQSLERGVIVMTSQDLSYYASVRVVEPALAEMKQTLRAQIAGQYAGASGVEEFATTVADQEGTGFQLRQDLPGLPARHIKVLWVPFKVGVLEFTLVADTKSAPIAQGALDMILLSFRSNERGRLELVTHSDKS
jgi:hypothetical protein